MLNDGHIRKGIRFGNEQIIMIAISNLTNKVIDKLLIALLAIEAIAWRFPFLGKMLASDSAIRAYLSQEILEGSIPYRDIFNNKPPVIFYLGAFFTSLANDPALGYWLMEAAFVIFAATAVFVSVRKTSSPLTAFLFTSIFIIFSNVSIYYYLTPGFIEYPAAAFTAWAYFLALYGRKDLSHFASGILVVLTVMSHQLSLIACMPIWFWLAYHRRWRELSSHFLGMTLAAGLLLGWLHSNGALDGMIYEAFTFGYFYFKAHPTGIAEYRLPILYYLLVPVPFLLASIPLVLKEKNESLLVFLWLLSAIAALLFTGFRLYAHYFVILAAPMTLALANGWAIARYRLPKTKSWQRFALATAFLLPLMVVTAYSSSAYFDRTRSRLSVTNIKNFENPYVELVEAINKLSFRGNRRLVLYVGFGNPAEVALLTNTRMPGPYAYFGDFFSIPHPQQSAMTRDWIENIQSNNPILVVEDKRHFYPIPEILSNWIRENYTLVEEIGEFRVLVARHGRVTKVIPP